VFPDDLPGLPPDRDVEFVIELKLDTAPISQRAYRMHPMNWQNLRINCKSYVTNVLSDPVPHHGDVWLFLLRRKIRL
jgi:hypothetical protein